MTVLEEATKLIDKDNREQHVIAVERLLKEKNRAKKEFEKLKLRLTEISNMSTAEFIDSDYRNEFRFGPQ